MPTKNDWVTEQYKHIKEKSNEGFNKPPLLIKSDSIIFLNVIRERPPRIDVEFYGEKPVKKYSFLLRNYPDNVLRATPYLFNVIVTALVEIGESFWLLRVGKGEFTEYYVFKTKELAEECWQKKVGDVGGDR